MAEHEALEDEFELKWRFGARAAILVNERARRFDAAAELSLGGGWADAKELVPLLMLAHGAGPAARVRVSGRDARAAFAELRDLFTCGPRVFRCRRADCHESPVLVDYDRARAWYSCAEMHLWWEPRAKERALEPADML